MKAAALLPHVRALIAVPAADAELLDRFVRARDQDAFSTLVRRHGPLVLATARRVVGNPDDADDVFQATFLLLARNAAAIRNRAAVAGWLHGVASRMARTARRTAARRRTYEARAQSATASTHSDLSWREVQQAFEEELARLPDQYRVPFVSCALNGEPRADVARQLRVKEGTISSRLAEAKRRLQERLSARGVSLAAFLGAVSLPTLAISSDLLSRTVRTAAIGPVPASVSALLRGGLMTLPKTLVLAAVLGIGAILAGTGGAGDATRDAGKDTPAAKAPAATEKMTVRGTLLDADGVPIADAPVRLWSFRTGEKTPDPITKTAADGTFQFEADPKDSTEEARVVLTPPGRPAHWAPLSKFARDKTLRLPADDVPFTGRITSLENQPLKGVTVEVVRVSNIADGDLTAWLEKNVAMRKESYWMNEGGLVTLPGGLVVSTPKTTTDADGKFKLAGFGRDRVLTVRVHGANLETKFFWVVTQPGGPREGYIKTPDFNHGVYPPDVTVMLAPSRPLIGTVRDTKTGQPVAGVKVSEVNTVTVSAITDKDGKYRLEGIPKKKHYGLNVCGVKGQPYFDFTGEFQPDVAGLDPLVTDLSITRGVELTGRVLDKAGRPVRADVFYHPHGSNPNAKPSSFGFISSDGWRTKPDGTFYLTVWPGKGVLDIRANDSSKYMTVDVEKTLSDAGIRSRPVGAVHGLLPVDVDEAKPESLDVIITLQEGLVRKGTVVDPDGKPAAGVVAAGLTGSRPGPLKTGEFNVSGMSSTSRRLLLFLDDGKKLGAIAPVSGEATDPLTIKLQPLASVEGEVRLGDTAAPAGFTVTAVPYLADTRKYENLPDETLKMQGIYGMQKAPWWKLFKRTTTTDKDGRFQLKGLVPGLEYTIYVSDGDLGEAGTLVASKSKVTVEAGKTTDLGVLQKKSGE